MLYVWCFLVNEIILFTQKKKKKSWLLFRCIYGMFNGMPISNFKYEEKKNNTFSSQMPIYAIAFV